MILKTVCIVCAILFTILVLYYAGYPYSSLFYFSVKKFNPINPEMNDTHSPRVFFNDKLLMNITISIGQVYHHNGSAYDYYSKDELGQSKAAYQWKVWPLPHEINQTSSFNHTEMSPFVFSKLPFINTIYLISAPYLIDRHANVKNAFNQQGILVDSIEWRMKWNRTTCNSESNRSYVYQRLNLKDIPLDKEQQQRCAITMEHVDIWYEIAERKIGLALILEDDAIFVPFFKEKFTRMIYAAIHNGILRINGTCVKSEEKPISDDEWIHQNAMIVIGTCFNMHNKCFQKHLSNASPIFTTNKLNSTRCSHAYLLTSCSAQASIDQLQAQKNDFRLSDVLQDYLFRLSPNLQSFWIDPPLVHQGNHVIDLDQISSFKVATYMLVNQTTIKMDKH